MNKKLAHSGKNQEATGTKKSTPGGPGVLEEKVGWI
jgi:hypothetical protein